MKAQNTALFLDVKYPQKKYQNYANTFDYVFVGLGASNSLMLLSFIKEGLLIGKSVAVIDADLKNQNDKTYCFWAPKNSEMVQSLKPIISYAYTKLSIDNSQAESIEDEPYFYIKSIDLYNHLKQELKNHNITFYNLTVSKIITQNTQHKIITNNESFITNNIFDSRPPKLKTNNPKDIFLLQSFFGLHVKFNQNVFDENTFDMMNFEIAQDNYTQFVYTLPFSQNEALIEFTRFGVDIIEPNYGKKIVEQYIKKLNAPYIIIAEEKGCIPMTTIKVPKSTVKGILNTGARANLIKPSTGYGFKNMYNFAATAAQHIKKNGSNPINLIVLKKQKRFQFYDNLLLIILFRWPHLGKPIFKSLFKKQGGKKVLAFLDEQTSIFKEVGIFLFLPLKPFLKALFINIYQSVYLRLFIVFSFVCIYHALYFFDTNLALTAAYIFLIAGMLIIGIPHGAVDHLLHLNKKFNIYLFTIKYLLIVLIFYLFWVYIPLVAIVLFIVYSAFHFGQSELKEIGKPINLVKNLFLSFLLGISILFFIIFTHFQESVNLISKIKGLELIFMDNKTLILIKAPAILISSGVLLWAGLYFNKTSMYLLLTLLLLSTTVPLLFAFGIYFICQHSVNAWQHIKTELNIKQKQLLKKAFPFSFAAILLFALFAVLSFFINHQDLSWLSAQFFIFLACISLPHVLLMHKFYNNKT